MRLQSCWVVNYLTSSYIFKIITSNLVGEASVLTPQILHSLNVIWAPEVASPSPCYQRRGGGPVLTLPSPSPAGCPCGLEHWPGGDLLCGGLAFGHGIQVLGPLDAQPVCQPPPVCAATSGCSPVPGMAHQLFHALCLGAWPQPWWHRHPQHLRHTGRSLLANGTERLCQTSWSHSQL